MIGVPLLFGALRTQIRSSPNLAKSAIHPLLHLRSLATLHSTSPLLRSKYGNPLISPNIPRSRLITLSSIFAPRKPSPTPSPQVVASISAVETEANAKPHDVLKQIELYELLLATGVKAGYDVVIARWESMCEHDPASPLLHSEKAFQLYIAALINNGLQTSINNAVRRRDSLLAASAVTATQPDGAIDASDSSAAAPSSDPTLTSAASSSPASSSPAPSSTVSPIPPLPATAAAPVTPPSLKQQIAENTLNSSSSNPNANLSQLLAAGAGGPSNPITVVISETKGAWIPRLVRFLVLTGVSVFFVVLIMAVLLENSGLVKAGPRQAEFEPTQQKTYKFSDVHGVDEAKDELQEVVEFLKDPSSFATLGGKLPKGILLTGPPGTGKTMLARAVAGEAGVPFLFASGSEFDEMFVGVGAKRVRDLFALARKKQPAIIFIDELDAIGGKRSNRDQHYMKQTLNQLLVEMDGFLQTEGVIVIAATNFPESLDAALIRPGRFDRHIAVPLPDVRGRTQILTHHMKGVTTAPEIDPMILARGTAGFSGADLQNMVNQAAVQASREGARAVNLKHFEWAKDRILMGAERKSSYISDEVKRLTAYHEGGHALVALYTDGAMPLHKVTCVPRGHALGITSQLPLDDRYSVSLKEYKAQIDVCMGGRVAEELIYGPDNVTSGASSDLQQATRSARAMVKRWGFSQKVGPVYYDERDEAISPQIKQEIDSEVRTLLREGESRVVKLLKSKEEELHRLANALMEHETLDAEEVQKVIKGEPIRGIVAIIQEDLSRMAEKEQSADSS